MGAVSYLYATKEVKEKLKDIIDVSNYGGGYFDQWGSSFKLSIENGKIVINFEGLGEYLSVDALGGWYNDYKIRPVLDREFNGVFSQWSSTKDDRDINYLIIENEVIAIGRNGEICWLNEQSKDLNIDELTKLCNSKNNDFFDFDWEIPKYFLGEVNVHINNDD